MDKIAGREKGGSVLWAVVGGQKNMQCRFKKLRPQIRVISSGGRGRGREDAGGEAEGAAGLVLVAADVEPWPLG